MPRYAPRRLESTFLMTLIGGFLVYAGTGFAAAEANFDLIPFEGEWSLIESERDDTARISAIEEAVDDLSWVWRQVARPVLTKTTVPPSRIQFTWDGTKLYQHIPESKNEGTRPIAIGGEPLDSTDSRGEPFVASWQWTDQGLQLRWEQHQAFGYNVYRVDPDTGMLVVRHTINITALSNMEPIVFEARFGRSQLSSVSAARPEAAREEMP